MKLAKKGFGYMDQLPTIFLLFGIAVIIASITTQITGSVRTNQCGFDGGVWNATGNRCMNNASGSLTTLDVTGYAYNVSSYGLSGEQSAAQWFTTIGLIIGAVVVLGALFMLLANRG